MTAQDNGQAPPNNADAESAVVGSIVLENDRIANVGRLRPADFYGSHHRLLFAAINDMIAAGTPVDAVTLGEEMERRGQLEEIGGAGYIVEILDSVPHSFNADYYAKIVIEKTRLRRLTQLGRKILDEASDPAMTSEHVRERLLDFDDVFRGDDQADRFTWYTAKELAAGDFKVAYHIPGILAEKIPTILSGAFKTLKTSIAADLHLSLSTGDPFLGKFRVTRPCRTAFMSGESGLSALQSAYQRICSQKGWSLDRVGNFIVTPDLPQLADPSDLRNLERFIEGEGIEVLLIDPVYLALDLNDREGSIFNVGRQLRPLGDLISKTGCTITIVHHNNNSKRCVPRDNFTVLATSAG